MMHRIKWNENQRVVKDDGKMDRQIEHVGNIYDKVHTFNSFRQ